MQSHIILGVIIIYNLILELPLYRSGKVWHAKMTQGAFMGLTGS